jgi:hypothetical protein
MSMTVKVYKYYFLWGVSSCLYLILSSSFPFTLLLFHAFMASVYLKCVCKTGAAVAAPVTSPPEHQLESESDITRQAWGGPPPASAASRWGWVPRPGATSTSSTLSATSLMQSLSTGLGGPCERISAEIREPVGPKPVSILQHDINELRRAGSPERCSRSVRSSELRPGLGPDFHTMDRWAIWIA